MSCCSPQVGDSLTVTLTLIQCGSDPETPIDISSQTAMEIVILGPGSVRHTEAASFVTDGTDGKMTASFPAGDLSVSGEWKVQGNVTLTGPLTYHTEVKTFNVNANI